MEPGEYAVRTPHEAARSNMNDEAGQDDLDRLSILVVCTGNVCRSPLAEQLILARLAGAGLPVQVTSAGTHALVGQPMTPEAASLSVGYGGNPSAHRARQVTAELVEEADLILTATRDQRGEVVSLAPATSRHTFTLRQFARIAASPDVQAAMGDSLDDSDGASPRITLQSYIAAIAASRGYAPPPARAGDDDILDPYRQSKQVYRRVGRSIDEAVTTIVSGLTSAVARVE